MFNIFKSHSTKQTIDEARSAYNNKKNKSNKKADAERRKLFNKFFKKIAKSMKDCGHYILNREEMKELNNGWLLCGLDVKSVDPDRSLRKAFDEKLELESLRKNDGFYTGQLRLFLLEAREAGLVIKHNWVKSNTFNGWTVSGLIFSFPRDNK